MNGAAPEITAIVCTRNRAAVLGRCVRAAARQRAAFPFEVLVVDNGSSDGTAELCRALAAELPGVRLVVEPEAGLSRARNRGAREARAPLLAYLDDDAEPTGDWIAALRAAFAESDAALVGGPILARFEEPAPRWLAGHVSLLSCQDLGPARCRVDAPPYLFGANLALRREALDAAGGFDPSLGRSGARLFQDEDTDLCERLLAAGRTLLYEPAAVVFHWISAERLTRAYLRRRAYDTGRTLGFRLARERRGAGLAAAAAAKAAKLPLHGLLWLAASALGQHETAVARERSALTTLGLLARVLDRRGTGGGP